MHFNTLIEDVRRKEDPVSIIDKIKRSQDKKIKLRYVCQIFKSIKLLSMDGCQERCHVPTLSLAVLLLSNNLRSSLKILCQATFCFVVVGVGSFFDWFIMNHFLKVGIKRVDASEGEITTVKRLQTFRGLTFRQTKE